jgi:fatty acid desaturase
MSDRSRGKRFILNVFPLLQMTLFALACYLVDIHLALAIGALALSALALNFSIHICLHEYLHYSDCHPLRAWANVLYTAVAGLPFDGYRMHHHNHHRFDNGPLDYSCTHRETPRGRQPFGMWRYALGWPGQLKRARVDLASNPPRSRVEELARGRIAYEKWVVVLTILGLAVASWKYALLYVGMVYAGWVFISMHNYGQHPPELPGSTTSFSNGLYNRLFFNNGLHFEHHAEPGKPWHDLEPDARATQITGAHLVAPLRGNKAVKTR